MLIRLRGLVLLAALLGAAGVAGAEWVSLSTDRFVVFYRPSPRAPARDALARELLAELESARDRIVALTGGARGRLAVVIQDLGTYTNGLADPVFRRVVLYPYDPEAAGELSFATRPLRSLAVHELTHIGQLTASSGVGQVLAAIFGPLLAPGLLSPGWLAEGLAVYMESQPSPYEGRLNDGVFDAAAHAQAAAGKLPTLARATFSTEVYPFGTAAYLYGGLFVRYLADLAGEEALSSFLKVYAGSLLSYLSPALPLAGLDRAARETWGKGIRDLWRDWSAAMAAAAVPEPGVPLGGDDTPAEIGGLRWVDESLYYTRTLTAKTGVLQSRSVHQIVRQERDTGHRSVLVTTPAYFTAPFRIGGGRLTYAVAELEGGHENNDLSGYGVTTVLRSRPLAGGPDRVVLRAPLRCFVVTPAGEILYAVDDPTGSGSELWRKPVGSPATRVRRFEARVVEMDTDGVHLVLGTRADGRNEDLHSLALHDLDGDPRPLDTSPWAERTPSVSGGLVLYTTNVEGTASVRAVDLSSGERWSYEAGVSASWPVSDPGGGEIAYVSLAADGPGLVTHPVRRAPIPDVAAAAAGVPEHAAPPVTSVRVGGWAPNLATLLPRVRLPLITTNTPYFQYFRAGLWLAGESAIGDVSYDVRGLYDFTTLRPMVEATLTLAPPGPLSFVLDYDSVSSHTLSAGVSLLAWRSLQTGLSYVRLGAAATARSVFTRLDFSPTVSLVFRFPWSDAALTMRVPIESTLLGATADRVALHGTLTAGAMLLGGEVDLLGRLAWEPMNPAAAVVPLIRGQVAGLSGEVTGSLHLGYEHALLKIRDGLWNPSIYLGDLVVGVFGEGAASAAAVEAAAGVSLALEVRILALGTGLPVVVEGWVGVDERPSFLWGWTISSDIPLIARKVPDTAW